MWHSPADKGMNRVDDKSMKFGTHLEERFLAKGHCTFRSQQNGRPLWLKAINSVPT
jgi:hypothetical protein